MKINFSQKIEAADGSDLTLSQVAFRALNTVGDGGKVTFDEAYRRGKLSLKVRTGGEHDVTAEDIALIKKNLASVYVPYIVALATELLELS